MRNMTCEEILKRSKYSASDEVRCEAIDWLSAIAKFC